MADYYRLNLGIVLEGDVMVACPLGPSFSFEVGFLSELIEVLQEYAAMGTKPEEVRRNMKKAPIRCLGNLVAGAGFEPTAFGL